MPGLVKHIAAGTADLSWFDVQASHGRAHALFRMLVDAPKVGGVRLTVTAEEARDCAAQLGAILPTPRLLDWRWAACKCKIDPQPWNYRGGRGMMEPEAVVAHSLRVDDAILRAGHGSVSNTGKHWVLSRKTTANRAVLYGWHLAMEAPPYPQKGVRWRGIDVYASATFPFVAIVQPDYLSHHSHSYHDYSMTAQFVQRRVRLRRHDDAVWEEIDIGDLLADDELCNLASHEGALEGV